MSSLDGILVFSAIVVKRLNSDQVRLPPNYVGVRRVRASNRMVWNAFRSNDKRNQSSSDDVQETGWYLIDQPVTFKVTDSDGVERRMTTQEKKELKRKLRKERYEANKKSRHKASTSPIRDQREQDKSSTVQSSNDEQHSLTAEEELMQQQQREYHQLQVSSKAINEELAELRGERSGVPPVLLSPPMVRQAVRAGVVPQQALSDSLSGKQSSPQHVHAQLDDHLARRWAEALKMNMKSAEEVRAGESIRPMAYQLVPEVWTRMRPRFEEQRRERIDRMDDKDEQKAEIDEAQSENAVPYEESIPGESSWCMLPVRQCVEPLDSEVSIVYDYLYRHTNLQISCGAKFGCDFLLYDGPREERHAFAGLRVCFAMGGRDRTGDDGLPLPTAYDLAGFVRCLNTAGKLALLAAVCRCGKDEDPSPLRVAFVDLALEKILSAPTHQKRSNKKPRRDMGKNLAKTNSK